MSLAQWLCNRIETIYRISQVLICIFSYMPQFYFNFASPSHPRPLRMILFCFRCALKPYATGTSRYEAISTFREMRFSPTACMILCVRFVYFVRRNSIDSAIDATLDTGGWLNLSRQGLSPCKMHQACLAH